MMKKMINKGLAAAVILGLGLSFGGFASTPVLAAEPETTSVNVQVEVQQKTAVNWEKGAEADITAVGIGLPPENAGARGNALARRAAIVDAYRLLAETVQGLQLDSETTVEDLTLTSDVVKTKISAVVKGARLVDEGVNADGSYYVKMSIPMYGAAKSIAAAVMPEVTKNVVPAAPAVVEPKKSVLPKEEVKEIKKETFTGVIVDAGGLGLEATFSPVIYDENGRVIYGIANINQDFAISKGMVTYANDVAMAKSDTRAGANPIVVKAVAVKGGANSVNKVNVVVSAADGDRILLANEHGNMLQNCSVVFVK